MAVHLIFCRIIAEVVRPLPPLVCRYPPAPSFARHPRPLRFLPDSPAPPPPPPVAVGRVDERGRALCLTFCKNSPPVPPPTVHLHRHHRHHLYVLLILSRLLLHLLPRAPSTLFFLLPYLLRHHFLTLRCPVSPIVFCCTRSDVRHRYIALSRRRISNMMGARAQSLSILSLSLPLLFLPSFPFIRARCRVITNSERKGTGPQPVA